MMTMVMMMTIAISATAMTYSAARNEALFLSDKMAYELGLTASQYEAVYEINLDYLLNVNNRADVFGFWWEVRNRDLRYVLSTWQYDLFVASEWFYRPIIWTNSGVTFSIYARYNHGRMFRNHPTAYVNFSGGHSHKNNSFYTGHHFDKPNAPSGHGNGNHNNNNGNSNHNNGNHNHNNNNGNHNSNGNWSNNGNHNGNPNGNSNHNNNNGNRPSRTSNGNNNNNPSMGGGFGNNHGSGSANAPSRTGGSRTSGTLAGSGSTTRK